MNVCHYVCSTAPVLLPDPQCTQVKGGSGEEHHSMYLIASLEYIPGLPHHNYFSFTHHTYLAIHCQLLLKQETRMASLFVHVYYACTCKYCPHSTAQFLIPRPKPGNEANVDIQRPTKSFVINSCKVINCIVIQLCCSHYFVLCHRQQG